MLVTAVTTVLLAMPTSSGAAGNPTCTVPQQLPCSVFLDPSNRPNGRFSQSPDRAEIDVVPGKTSLLEVSLTNYIAQPVHIKVAIVDIGLTHGSSPIISVLPKGEFSAHSWVTSTVTEADLQPLEQLKFYLSVTPPLSASVGTSMAGMTVHVMPVAGVSPPKSPSGATVNFNFQGLSQLYFTVQGGELKYDTRIMHARVADTFVVGGRRVVEYEVDLQNFGNVNDHAKGNILVKSLFGNKAAELWAPNVKPTPKEEIKKNSYLILRGAKHTIRVAWIDTPRFGYFSAKANLRTHDGRVSKQFPGVIILPPWWVIALIIVTLLLPFVYRWWQRRREMQLLIEAELEGWDLDDEDDESY